MSDGATERLALLGVLDRLVDAALGGTDAQRGDGDAAFVEDAQEVRVAAAALTEQILFGDTNIGERERMGVGCVPTDFVSTPVRP